MEVFKQANEGQKYQRDIAKDFGIDQQMVSMIKRKRAFKWIHG
jgi:DNA-binding MarR family transcriptional regulator